VGQQYHIQRNTKSCKSPDLQLFAFLAHSSKTIKNHNDGEQNGEQIFFVYLLLATTVSPGLLFVTLFSHFIFR
jgi:hypothetical protein